MHVRVIWVDFYRFALILIDVYVILCAFKMLKEFDDISLFLIDFE